MFAHALTTFALLAAVSNAFQVQSPTNQTVWSSGSSSQTVSWEGVSTDATSFAIQLVNQAGFLSNSPVTLVANQSAGTAGQMNSVSVTYPNGNWPTGTAFQINLVSSTEGNSAILAQSGQFNITSSGATSASSSSSSSGTAPSTLSVTSAATVTTVTQAETSGSTASTTGGGIPGAVTSTAKSSADTVFGTPSTLVGLLMGAAAVIGVTF